MIRLKCSNCKIEFFFSKNLMSKQCPKYSPWKWGARAWSPRPHRSKTGSGTTLQRRKGNPCIDELPFPGPWGRAGREGHVASPNGEHVSGKNPSMDHESVEELAFWLCVRLPNLGRGELEERSEELKFFLTHARCDFFTCIIHPYKHRPQIIFACITHPYRKI